MSEVGKMEFYEIKNIKPFEEGSISDGTWLVIMHASRVPPHLALAVNGTLYSIGVQGPVTDKPVDGFIDLAEERGVKLLVFKITTPEVIDADELTSFIKGLVLQHKQVETGKVSCLAPLRDFCGKVFAFDTAHVKFVFDLLEELYRRNLVQTCMHLNMDALLEKDTYRLKKYTADEVNKATSLLIKKLKLANKLT